MEGRSRPPCVSDTPRFQEKVGFLYPSSLAIILSLTVSLFTILMNYDTGKKRSRKKILMNYDTFVTPSPFIRLLGLVLSDEICKPGEISKSERERERERERNMGGWTEASPGVLAEEYVLGQKAKQQLK